MGNAQRGHMINFADLEASVAAQVPHHVPVELQSSCKCAPIDPDWPISGPIEALKLMMMWDVYQGRPLQHGSDYIHHLTHSHAYEHDDLRSLGVARLYKESWTTKNVSIAWHLAGRYDYDVALIDYLTKAGWPSLSMLEFGAAPWIQAIFYANKGLKVTAVNQALESDVNMFGRFLAEYKRGEKHGIANYASDGAWADDNKYDLIYCVDVLEHIPPLQDGSPGWIPHAERMLRALKPGGIWNVNAPLDYDPGPVKEVSYHNVHFTSPISVDDWCRANGLVQELYLWRKL